jgi:hypothetical protein
VKKRLRRAAIKVGANQPVSWLLLFYRENTKKKLCFILFIFLCVFVCPSIRYFYYNAHFFNKTELEREQDRSKSEGKTTKGRVV